MDDSPAWRLLTLLLFCLLTVTVLGLLRLKGQATGLAGDKGPGVTSGRGLSLRPEYR